MSILRKVGLFKVFGMIYYHLKQEVNLLTMLLKSQKPY